MTILVTGDAGFIGSHFIVLLKAKAPSVKIICVDSLTYAGRLDTLSSYMTDDDFVFSKTDICDREKIYELFERHSPDIVINFAAETHVDTSINSPSLFYKTNIYGTSVLLDACVKYGTHRFHQVSTDEVYGDTELDAATFFDENAPLRPSSPYSASKASADMLTLAYHRTFGLYTTISRSSNNYGPSQNVEKLIPKSITKALSGNKIPIYGDGMNIRDWIYVDDNCEAIWSIVLNGSDGEIYNVGDCCEKSNIEIATLICELTGAPLDSISFVANRRGHDRRYALDTTKIRRELGWSPKMSLRSGLIKTINTYRSEAD